MKKIDKLVRDKVSGLLGKKGYVVKTRILDDEQRKKALYSLFLCELREGAGQDPKLLQTHYADMVEIIESLSSSSINNITAVKSQALKWYERLMPKKEQVRRSKTNLLQKYDELLCIDNNEVYEEQLREVFLALKDLIEVQGLSFDKIQELCKERLIKLGGFTQGIYLEQVQKIVNVQHGI